MEMKVTEDKEYYNSKVLPFIDTLPIPNKDKTELGNNIKNATELSVTQTKVEATKSLEYILSSFLMKLFWYINGIVFLLIIFAFISDII